jgi:hypothetical protein
MTRARRVGAWRSSRNRSDLAERSIVRPASLPREARRPRGLSVVGLPPVCLVDPDEEIIRDLRRTEQARSSTDWPRHFADPWETSVTGLRPRGVVYAAGASFAVLVDQQPFVAGFRLPVSVASVGQATPDLAMRRFHLIGGSALGKGAGPAFLTSAPRSAPGWLASSASSIWSWRRIGTSSNG